LNEVFRGRKYIADLIYNKNEYPGDLKDEGAAIFDLLCTGANGEKFLIEVQRGRQGNFKERALFYTSRLISDQAPKGRRSEWAYNLTEVYLVALLEDFTLQISDGTEYLHDICLCNRETGQIFYDKLGYIYLELNKFVKEDSELESDLDRWLYVLKNMSRMDKIPVYLRKPIFEKLFNIAEYSNLTKEEKTLGPNWKRDDDIAMRYNELLYAVGNKYPGETRHQTALRYIRNAEKPSTETSQVANVPPPPERP